MVHDDGGAASIAVHLLSQLTTKPDETVT